MSLPDTPTPPRYFLVNDERALLIDTEGGLCLLHPQRLNSLDPIRHPFPGDITNSALIGEHFLVSTWVERDLSLARLALLDLREPIKSGIEMSELRVAVDAGKSNHHHVAGAVWSHILDAEPLALCEHEGNIVFCTHHRGIYRIGINSEEIWRRKPLTWDLLSDLPDGDVVINLVSVGDSIWVFSLGGGWAEIEGSSGQVIRKGIHQFKSSTQQVWHGEGGNWLLGLSENRMAWWDSESERISVVNVNGSIQDACMNEGSWFITGWRQDLLWSEAQFNSNPVTGVRAEIGCKIVNRSGEGIWVLDNRGQWSTFAIGGNSP
ncbi:MAG: hypothetical protein CMJ72_03505 [Planctomycetaceae bacterium]|nr:hypothetical protein [Planctomycetaceae bacterium]